MLGAGALGRPRGMVWGGRREEGSGWGTRVYLWRIHVDIWQNQYNIVKLKNKIKKKGMGGPDHKKKKKDYLGLQFWGTCELHEFGYTKPFPNSHNCKVLRHYFFK